MILIFAFFAFIFIKVMPDMLDIRGQTVLNAGIVAVASSIFIVGANAFALARASAYCKRLELSEGKPEFPWFLILPYAVVVLAACAASFLIAAGFAPRLYREIWNSYYGISSDGMWYCAVVSIPIISYIWLPISQVASMLKDAEKNRPLTSSLHR